MHCCRCLRCSNLRDRGRLARVPQEKGRGTSGSKKDYYNNGDYENPAFTLLFQNLL